MARFYDRFKFHSYISYHSQKNLTIISIQAIMTIEYDMIQLQNISLKTINTIEFEYNAK